MWQGSFFVKPSQATWPESVGKGQHFSCLNQDVSDGDYSNLEMKWQFSLSEEWCFFFFWFLIDSICCKPGFVGRGKLLSSNRSIIYMKSTLLLGNWFKEVQCLLVDKSYGSLNKIFLCSFSVDLELYSV